MASKEAMQIASRHYAETASIDEIDALARAIDELMVRDLERLGMWMTGDSDRQIVEERYTALRAAMGEQKEQR